MKLGQLTDYNKRNINEVKAGGLQLRFNIFPQPSTQDEIKTNL